MDLVERGLASTLGEGMAEGKSSSTHLAGNITDYPTESLASGNSYPSSVTGHEDAAASDEGDAVRTW